MTAVYRSGSDDPSKKWEARPRIEGNRPRVHGSTRADVERKIAALKDAAHRRKLGLGDPLARPVDVTYDALCEKVLDAYLHSEQAKRTLAANLKRSRKKFGRLLVRELTAEAVQTWLAGLELSETTRRSSLKAMRQALQQAVEWNYAPKNVAASVEMPKEPPYDAYPFEAWADVLTVSDATIRTVDKALVRFASATGLRSAGVAGPSVVRHQARREDAPRKPRGSQREGRGSRQDGCGSADGAPDRTRTPGARPPPRPAQAGAARVPGRAGRNDQLTTTGGHASGRTP